MSASKFLNKVKSFVAVTGSSSLIVGGLLYHQNDEKFFENFLMPLMRLTLKPESQIELGIFLCKHKLLPKNTYKDPPSLATTICGIKLKNAVGMAAGYDRDCEAFQGLDKIGFGFVEVGTILPEEPFTTSTQKDAQIFLLNEDNSIINRNDASKGHSFSVPIMRRTRRVLEYNEIIGFNIGKNVNSDAVKDISYGVKVFSPVANYLVINIDNHPFTTDISKRNELREVLKEVNIARLLFDADRQRPIFLKLSPDLAHNDLKCIIDITNEKNCKIHGFIVSSATHERDFMLRSKYKVEAGGLSGAALRDKSTQMIENVYRMTNGKIPIIGVGGITNGKDAYEKVLAGASAVQIYTSFIYCGPPVVNKIKRELNDLLLENGYENIAQAVGKNVPLKRNRFSWLPFFK